MVQTGEKWSTRKKPLPSATLSTRQLTRTGLGSNPGFHDEKPSTYRLSHGRTQKTNKSLHYT
jgi:hypothetical protein